MRLAYWLEENWPWLAWAAFLLGVFALAISAFAHVADGWAAEKARFMTECQKEKKEYECTALWRAGEPQVVPVVVPVGGR